MSEPLIRICGVGGMTDGAITMSLEPSAPRQLDERGLIIFWRDGMEPGRREGLACILSICPHPECACQLVYIDGFVIDAQATEVCWDQEGIRLRLPAGSEPARAMLDAKMIAIVDPSSGETEAHPDLPDAADPALIDWLASEMNGELLDVLHRFRARTKGYPPERRRKDIDLDAVEQVHLAAFNELFEGVRDDEYLLGGCRYWTCIYLCPYADCDCHRVRVAFFDDEEESDDTVGSVLLDLSGAGGFKLEEMAAECGAPEHLIKDLWALFEGRYDIGRFLRRREAQFKAVGETLWRPIAKPVRAFPRPRRNSPCPCGSGRKFKKCCLGKDGGSPVAGGS
jgi:hypothetical protein